MGKALIEHNFAHIDDDDMTALIAIFEDLGIEAEPIEQSTIFKAAWWVLVLHWVETSGEGFVNSLPWSSLSAVVVRHYRKRGRTPPRRIVWVDKDGETIASAELEDE